MENTRRIVTLPPELIIDILSRLHVKDVLRFKCVSKQWLHEINSPDFIKLHSSRSLEASSSDDSPTFIVFGSSCFFSVSFQEDVMQSVTKLPCPPSELTEYCPTRMLRISLVGSCNGLLCFRLQSEKGNQFSLYNPCTNSYRALPPLRLKGYVWLNEFGYDSVNNDYKVLIVVEYFLSPCTRPRVRCREACIYSLKSDTWKRINQCPEVTGKLNTCCSVVNNAFHWLSPESNISSFNLGTEEYGKLSPPDESRHCILVSVASLKGNLHMVTESRDGDLSIWAMKEYGVKESWRRLFHCPYEPFAKSIPEIFQLQGGLEALVLYGYLKGGQNILIGKHRSLKKFISCSLQNYEATEKVEVCDLPGQRYGYLVGPWVASLVSPNNLDDQ